MKTIFLIVLYFASLQAYCQTYFFPKENYKDTVAFEKNIPLLAQQVLKTYKPSEADANSYINFAELQLVSGKYSAVEQPLLAGTLMNTKDTLLASAFFAHYHLLAKTKMGATGEKNFASEYYNLFEKWFAGLKEEGKQRASAFLNISLNTIAADFTSRKGLLSSKDSLSQTEAIGLISLYADYAATKLIPATVKQAITGYENEKYIIEDSILVKMPDGGTNAVTVVRYRDTKKPQPVVLRYNIYTGYDINQCKTILRNGYIGVIANPRGKRLSNDSIEPWEHDGDDAYYVIDWISKQPWCNGKIGMYGGSYLGFTQWASVKKLHPALKTIVPQVSVGIGIDYPSHNGIFMSYMLRWIHYVINNKLTDYEDFGNNDKWNDIFRKWYQSGKSFRSLDSVEGRPNHIFQRWLKHPTYDQYWQAMTPQGNAFANINIPILTTTGYWDDDQMGAMYYYHKYHKYNKNPNYYLVIGPWSHGGSQNSPDPNLAGYKIDSVAKISISKLVFKWFDYILKDSARPALLKDKVNFQVMGANEWKHVPELGKMANDTLKFYPAKPGGFGMLQNKKPSAPYFVQTADFKDRTQILPTGEAVGAFVNLLDSNLVYYKDLTMFVSEPFDKPTIMSGAPIANLSLSTNKRDVDINMSFIEQLPDGRYLALSENLQRASFATNRSVRKLLVPGKKQLIPFHSTFITCRQLQKGSRLIVLLGVNKNPNWQVNYGTGKDVSDETIADGNVPLEIKWYNESVIKVPVLK